MFQEIFISIEIFFGSQVSRFCSQMKVTYGVHFCMYLQNESLNTMTCNTCYIVGISSLRQNVLCEDVQDYENDCIYNLGFNNVVSTMDQAKDELLKRYDTIDN